LWNGYYFDWASAKYLGLPSEQHYLKWVVEFLHVQFVIVFYRNQEVVIVGAGILLWRSALFVCWKKVTMLVQSGNLEPKNMEVAFAKPKILPS
jgi:thioredoxin reductase (NADPH)